jgi:HEAT repeat protein
LPNRPQLLTVENMKRNVVIASGLIGAFVLLLLLLLFRPPHYAGKSVDHWMSELTSTNEAVRTNAVVAIRALGTKAIPAVLSRVEARPSVWRSKADRWLTRFRIRIASPPSISTLNGEAREALWALGTNATAAIPGLTVLLSKPTVARRACYLLTTMNDEVVPALIIATTNVDAKVREDAMLDLGRRRVNTPEVVDALLRALRSDPNPATRAMAAYALGRIPGLPAPAIESMVKVLEDSNAPIDLLRRVIQALGEQGLRATAAVPALVRMSQQPATGGIAKTALTKIDPETAAKHGIKVPRENLYE